jgi:cyanophycin synthetase
MKLLDIRTLPGPNIYHHRPVLVSLLDLESLTGKESTDFPGFTDRLLALLPGLRDHHCGLGYPGGFVDRLNGGTYFGHIAEHVAIETANVCGVGVRYGQTRNAGQPNLYRVVVRYEAEQAMRFLLQAAVELVEALAADRPYPLDVKLTECRCVIGRTELGPSTRAIVDAATRRNIPWFRLNEASLVQLGYGAKRRFVQAAESSQTSAVAVEIACDKALTKRLLRQAEIPVPGGVIVASAEEAVKALDDLRPPLAVKPLDGNQGKGVTLNVRTAAELAAAYEAAAGYSADVVIEECFLGKDFRVLVVDGKVVAASERAPAQVTGDGTRTVGELIEAENRDPLRGEGHEKPLTQIRVDDALIGYLTRRGRGLADVPAAGEAVPLRETANLSTGGTAADVTELVHPDVAAMCERAARVIGLDICGVDLILPDIAAPLPRSGGGVIELNAAPGLRMHHYPSRGKPRDAGAAIVEVLFPGGDDGRIPVVSVTGTNGKTTTTRMTGAVMASLGRVVGMTTSDGIWIGGRCVKRGDTTGFHSARAVLADPTVEVAVLETARGGIVRRSLGYDWSDVGVLTNVQQDHIGQDGITGLEDLVHIKSLVLERVRAGGTLVLNADDPHVAKLADRPRIAKVRRTVVYFSLDYDNPVVRRHRTRGGTAYLARDGWVIEAAGSTEQPVMREAEVPATLGGSARFQVANVLAAVAACRALGVSRERTAASLARFESAHNPGRMNLYRVNGGYAVVDYGHNPGAFGAVCELAARWQDRQVTGVFTVPGDRDGSVIEAAARVLASGGFDRLIVREDADPRGRKPGEVAALLCRAVSQCGRECRVVLDECDAVRAALDEMAADEVVMLFSEDRDAVRGVLREYGAEPVAAVPPVLQPA